MHHFRKNSGTEKQNCCSTTMYKRHTLLKIRLDRETYGSFMRMNTLAMKKLRRTLTNPMKSNKNLLSLGMFGALERSRIMKPRPPIVKRKLEASPSMMYCPFTLEK